MRIATYNIQHGRRPGGVVDPALLASSVAGLGADVVGLQEVDIGAGRSGGADIPAVVEAGSGLTAVFGESFLLRDGGRYGNTLLVRGTAHDVEVVGLPWLPHGDRRRRHTVLLARCTVRGVAMSVGVCHLGRRAGEGLAQLVVALEVLGRRPAPRVLVGDLNVARRHVRPVVEAAGYDLANAWPTHPAHRPFRRIDHVAVEGLAIRRARVHHLPVSDHRALVVDCVVPRSP